MDKLPQICAAMQEVLQRAAVDHAQSSGFQRRESKLSAQVFVQTLVFTLMAHPQASLSEMAQTAALLGVELTPQALDDRFTPACCGLLCSVLQRALEQAIAADATVLAVLQKFTHVELFDSTTVGLPLTLLEEFPGCGTAVGGSAAMKLQVRLDLSSGQIHGPQIRPARLHDNSAQMLAEPVEEGSLWIGDLGYFDLERFARIAEQRGYWLSRYKLETLLFDDDGQPLDLLTMLKASAEVDRMVLLGHKKLPCRLLAQRVSESQAAERRRKLRRRFQRHGRTPSKRTLQLCAWTILVTNVPESRLSLCQAMVLMRARWQIEILFKLWKSHGQIDLTRSNNPSRVLGEIYAKLIALLIEHWLMLLGVWRHADRSILKASQAVQRCAMLLAVAITTAQDLCWAIELILRAMGAACHLQRRRQHPSTFQLLSASDPAP